MENDDGTEPDTSEKKSITIDISKFSPLGLIKALPVSGVLAIGMIGAGTGAEYIAPASQTAPWVTKAGALAMFTVIMVKLVMECIAQFRAGSK